MRLLTWLLLLAACNRVEEPIGERRRAPPPAIVASTAPPALLAPTRVLALSNSAYQASLFADDEAIELLTGRAAYRLIPGKEPVQRAIDLGFAATVTRRNYVYWSQGALWSEPRRAPKPGGATKLAALTAQPQRLVADINSDEFAFLAHTEGERDAIQVLENRRVKTLYTSPGSIDALALIGAALYFVERPSSGSYRIARVQLSGGDATYTTSKSGRWPALLRGTSDVIYYDGGRREVLSLSPDLQAERVLAKDFICSPLAAATSVYCSTMEGIFELSPSGARRQIVAAPHHLITNLAVDAEQLVFISDVGAQGQDQLAVDVVPLDQAKAAESPR